MTEPAAALYTTLALNNVWVTSPSLFAGSGLTQAVYDDAIDELVALGGAFREVNGGVTYVAARALTATAEAGQVTSSEALARIAAAITALST